MKRTYKYALSAVLGLGLAVPAIAQTGFPDVKDSHWAADSVNRLKLSGLVHGFKDGEYKGDRTMTRYEMASAVYAIYAKLVCFDEEIEKKIKALEAKINSIKPNEPAPAVDLSDIRAALASMKNDIGTMKQWGADLAQLKRMSSAYANELKSLGADVKDMQKNISDVAARVSKLEMAPGGLNISGDANFWMGASQTASRDAGVYNQDGMYIPNNPNGAGFDNLTALHEIGIKIEDKKAIVPYNLEFAVGNTMNDGGGWGDQVPSLGHAITSENDAVWVRSLHGTYRPWNITVGRQGMELNKFILRRPDTTSFFMQKQWDDHKYLMDGAKMVFGPGDAGTLFMGQTTNASTTDGLVFQPIVFASQTVERMMGGTYAFKFGGDKGKITATYVDYDGSVGFTFGAIPVGRGEGPPPPDPSGVTRTNVYGVDFNYDFGGFQFQIGGGKSVGYGIVGDEETLLGMGSDTQNLDTLIDSQNSRWDASIGSHTDSHSFRLGYRNVEQNYNAPGDWGRVAIFRNLTDTKAYNASGSLMVTKKIGLHGWYEKGESISSVGDYTSWKAGVETDITSKWAADFTMEDTNFKNGFQGIVNGASSKFRTVRLGYDMGAMRTFHIFWQRSELNSVAGFGNGQGSFYGFQYSIKF